MVFLRQEIVAIMSGVDFQSILTSKPVQTFVHILITFMGLMYPVDTSVMWP